MNQESNNNWIFKTILVALGLFIIFNIYTTFEKNNKSALANKTSYTEFLQDVTNDKIKSVKLTETALTSRQAIVTPKEGSPYQITFPNDNILIPKLLEKSVIVDVTPPPEKNFWSDFFFSWGPTLLFIGVWIFFMKKMNGGGKGLFNFNKSKAKLINPDEIKETFADVVGCDEAKVEVQEFVDFLKNPDKFSKLGGKTPRGVLFSGPSGTGKTLLARALAKESGVPFFAISGSDFVEMFVGVGASRVRDMFETAKKAAPCVLFIDEIDAIGGKRGTGMGGGHDEKEQTLNQILVELDGMDGNKGVILVAATNRPETLDAALLRPGRIDRQVVVGLPDVNGREQILKIHSKDVPMVSDINLRKIARGTPGFSGAELSNLINEGAIFAARRGKKFVDQQDLEDAKDKLLLGLERPSLAMTEQDKRDTAYHESGHAIIAKLLKESDPIYKVSIIPRGRALGVTVQLPEKDRFSYKKEFLRDRIAILMGGRAAEELFCNTFTSGASNDISVATSTARSMIMKLGMSKLGPVAFGETQSGWGGDSTNTSYLSQKTLETIDLEVSELINDQYKLAVRLLTENKDKVEAMTSALMEVETLDDWQVENIMQSRPYNDNAGQIEFKAIQDARDQKDLIERQKQEKQEPAFVPDVVLT